MEKGCATCVSCIDHSSNMLNVARAPETSRLATKEEMMSWSGILDDRFQERFRVRQHVFVPSDKCCGRARQNL